MLDALSQPYDQVQQQLKAARGRLAQVQRDAGQAQARFTTGTVRSHGFTLTAGDVDLGGPAVRTWSYDGTVPGPVIR